MRQFSIAATILLSVFLAFQETLINPVLCFKTDGTINLEVAVGGFTCPCPHTHYNGGIYDCREAMDSEPLCCCDIPIGESHHAKISPEPIPQVSLKGDHLNKTHHGNISPPMNLEGRTFFRLLPLSKFLQTFLSPILPAILLC